MWPQTYGLFGFGNLASSLLAAIPILVILLLLGVFRRPAWMAGLLGLAATLLLAIFCYRMPAGLALSSAANGAAFGLFPISWVVFWAIALFRLTVESGKFEIIKDSIELLTPDPRLQALLVAFAFGGFLEGAAGFGTPVAIAASMLIGLGFSPFSASAACLLANTAPVALGSLGIPLLTLAGTTGLPMGPLGKLTAAICAPLAVITPLYLIAALGGRRSLRGIAVPALLAGVVFGMGQYTITALFSAQLADILAAILTMAAIVAYTKIAPPEAYAADPDALAQFSRRGAAAAGPASEIRIIPHYSAMEILSAWMPYALLVVCVLAWGWRPVQQLLNGPTLNFHWPHLHDLVYRTPPVVDVPAPYHASYTLNLFSASGTACMMACILSVFYLRLSLRQVAQTLRGTIRQLALPVLTIASVLAIAFTMNYSGATATLGLALARTRSLFPFFSTTLGWLGVFLTGSDTSSNALFGTLQVVTAKTVGVSPALMAASNSAGGTLGKMISLQTIAVAACATGMLTEEQGKLFRLMLRHSLILLVLGGLIVSFYAYWLSHAH